MNNKIEAIEKLEDVVMTVDSLKNLNITIGQKVSLEKESEEYNIIDGEIVPIMQTREGIITKIFQRHVTVDFGSYKESVQKVDFLTGDVKLN